MVAVIVPVVRAAVAGVVGATLVLALLAAAPLPAGAQPPLPLGRADIGADVIVFASSGDLWTVPLSGGEATPLTEGPGWDDTPLLSPDGTQVVFSRRLDGSSDLYVMPLSGGAEARRLTWHPKAELARDWSADGRILFTSDRGGDGLWRLYTIRLDDPWEIPLDLPRGAQASWSPDGTRLALTPWHPRTDWIAYRGGAAPRIDIVDLDDAAVEVIPRGGTNAGGRPTHPAGDWDPVWLGETIFFLSERDDTANLHAYDTRTRRLRQVSRFEKFGASWASGGPGGLVLVRHGELWRSNASGDGLARVPVTLPAPTLAHLVPGTASVADFVAGVTLGPGGRTAIVEARGDLFAVDAATGQGVALTATPGVADRTPVPSPDGTLLAWLSDDGGEYRLHIAPLVPGANGVGTSLGPSNAITVTPEPAFLHEPTWSPDARHLALADKHQRLWLVETASGRVELLDVSRVAGGVDFQPTFTVDGRHIAWSRHTDNRLRAVFTRPVAGGTVRRLSPDALHCESPVFAADGSELFMTASPLAPAAEDLGLAAMLHRPLVTRAILGVPLNLATAPGGGASPDVSYRVIRTEPRNWRWLARGTNGALTGAAEVRTGAPLGGRVEFALYRIDPAGGAEVLLLDGVRTVLASPDGATLLIQNRAGWGLATADSAAVVRPLDLDGLTARVDRRAEWGQMYRETIRLLRDYFHDPAHHGEDLAALEAEYAHFLPSLRHREDLTRLLEQLLAHVTVSHTGVAGGDDTVLLGPDGQPVRGKPVGLLGVDVERVGNRVRLSRVLSGDNLSGLTTGPLAQPEVNARPGEWLLAVNGVPVDATKNFYSFLEMERPGPMDVLLGPDSTGAGARTVRVRPLPGENTLRRMVWADDNRRTVERLSGGRLGYIYLPNTGLSGFELFQRGFFANRDRQGLVIDERMNSGGAPVDYIIEVLSRRPLSAYAFRDGADISFPSSFVDGPMVLLIDAMAGSGGDTLPWMFRRANLGPLIGTRTMGAGIGGFIAVPDLIDGGGVAIPNRAFFNPDGLWDIENSGVSPDIEVDITPADFRAGRDPQLERGVAEALRRLGQEPRKERRKPEPFNPARPEPLRRQ